MRKYLNKKAVCFFLAVFFAASAIVETGVYLIFLHNERALLTAYQKSAQETANNLTELFGRALSGGVSASNTVFSERWYQHFRNNARYYEHEFDSDTKYQIWNGLRGTVESLNYVDNILVVTPAMDCVICKYGWFSMSDYNRIYGQLTFYEESPGGALLAESKDENLSVIVLSDYQVRREKTIICLLIDDRALESALMKLLGGAAAAVRATLGEQTIADSGDMASAQYAFESAYSYPALTLRLGYPAPDSAAERAVFALVCAITLVCVLAASAVLTYVHIKPVSNIVLENGGMPSDLDRPYEYVRRYIGALQDNERRLNQEKENARAEMNRFLARAREDIAYGMLTNRFFRFDDADALLALPWLNEGLDMCLLLLAPSENGGAPALPDGAGECARYAVRLHGDAGEVALFWLSPELSPREKADFKAFARKQWRRENGRLCVSSEIISDLNALPDAYARLKASQEKCFKDGSALPEDERTRLADAIQAGEEALEALAEELMLEYSPEDLLLAAHTAFGRQTEVLPYGDEATRWGSAMAEMRLLCLECAAAPAAAQKYLDYIDAHFAEPDLDMNRLSDAFGRHRTLISKDIKALSGQTFTDLLREKRMRAALERIDRGQFNAMEIAREVGYTSYSTFKRAFQQTTGCTPTEYRERFEEPQNQQ